MMSGIAYRPVKEGVKIWQYNNNTIMPWQYNNTVTILTHIIYWRRLAGGGRVCGSVEDEEAEDYDEGHAEEDGAVVNVLADAKLANNLWEGDTYILPKWKLKWNKVLFG